MRKMLAFVTLFSLATVAAWAQAESGSQATPAKKPAAAAHPAAKPGQQTAIIETTVGKMTCTLFPDKAPIGVANFVGLATGTKDWKTAKGATKHGVPLYDGTIFHRVIPDFMIQGGDPAGTGSGPDPVAKFKNEVSSDLLFDRPGRLAYANAGPNTNSSQFFITEVATPHLNGNYTLFGQCDEATVTLVKQIARMTKDPSNDRPFRPVKITHITITHAAATAKPATPAAKKPAAAPAKPATTPN
jgi:cyclophilin family peptidyl-prolyl cis-trans isomerase